MPIAFMNGLSDLAAKVRLLTKGDSWHETNHYDGHELCLPEHNPTPDFEKLKS